MIELALIVAASTLAAGLAGSFALRLVPSVSTRLAGLSLLAVGLPLAAVLPRRDERGARLRETNVEASYVLVIHGVRWQSDFRVL